MESTFPYSQLVGDELTSSSDSMATDSSRVVPHLKQISLRLKLFTPHLKNKTLMRQVH